MAKTRATEVWTVDLRGTGGSNQFEVKGWEPDMPVAPLQTIDPRGTVTEVETSESADEEWAMDPDLELSATEISALIRAYERKYSLGSDDMLDRDRRRENPDTIDFIDWRYLLMATTPAMAAAATPKPRVPWARKGGPTGPEKL